MNSCKKTFTQLLASACLIVGMQFFSMAQAAPDAGRDGGNDRMPPSTGHGRPPLPMQDFQGPHDDGGNPPFLRGVELSEAQQDKIFSIMHKQEPLMREQAKAARKAQDALRALAASGEYEDAKAKTLAEAVARAMAEMTLQNARNEQQIYALLTPEQRKLATAVRSKRAPHRMQEEGFERSVERQLRPVLRSPMM